MPPSPHRRALFIALATAIGLSGGCAHAPVAPCPATIAQPAASTPPSSPPEEELRRFLADLDEPLRALLSASERANFVAETHITPDTEQLAATAGVALMGWMSSSVPTAARLLAQTGLSEAERRQLTLLRSRIALPPPAAPALRDELAALKTRLAGHYGEAKVCAADSQGRQTCRDLDALGEVLQQGKHWEELVGAWTGWHDTAAETRPMYERFVALANQGARELGFDDVGAAWRAGYDMAPDAFEAEVERLWQEVRPLYEQLHCYARRKLAERWGADRVPLDGPIPAHLLGNMWGQDWSALYPLLAPFPKKKAIDVTAALARKRVDARQLVRYGEGFFRSLGLPPLPDTFWARSLFVRPRDREVVCHPSAWDLSFRGDVRLKMCIRGTEDDLLTVHHELGHIYYFLAYKDLPTVFQDGANDGFHEAIGDAMALSVTPDYLARIGLLGRASTDEEAELDEQMKRALDKVAFLPFGRLIDQWRYDVFSGRTPPARYNAAWWELKRRYQGVAPPIPRDEDSFDAGAKYHVPANTPYTRYFLAAILQFQLHRGLCRAAGIEGPLHRCSIYGNVEAGRRLQALLAAGASRPWQESLAALSGERAMDATAFLDYFAPLAAWLAKQNAGHACGW